MPALTMLTFAPTIDSECTRLVLRHHAVAFAERDRLFGWVSILTLLHGGYGRLPLLYGSGRPISGSRAAALRFDGQRPSDRRLLPVERPVRQQVERDFATYNNDLGSAVAAFSYFHLLPRRDLMIESFGGPITPLGRALLPSVYGSLAALFRFLLRLREERIRDVALKIEELLAFTDERVGDGRRYLAGDRLTLGDLALMSALAPILVPPSYSSRVPPLEHYPDRLRQVVDRTRLRPTGRFVARLYEEVSAA